MLSELGQRYRALHGREERQIRQYPPMLHDLRMVENRVEMKEEW